MNKHNITIAACTGALVVALAGAGVAYNSYHQSQVNKQTVATAKANKAKAAEQNQVQVQTFKLNKVYAACIAEAKLAKSSNAGAVCAG